MKKNLEVINKKVIESIGFTEEETNTLIKEEIIAVSSGQYLYKNFSDIYEFARSKMSVGNFSFADKCLKLCVHINPFHFQSASLLLSNALKNENFEEATKYLRNLLYSHKEPFISTYRTYLYVLSTIMPLPGDLKELALNLEVSDLLIGDCDLVERPKQQYIRKLIYSQKFSYARKILYELLEQHPELKGQLKVLVNLLRYGATKQIERKATLEELVRMDDIDGSIEFLENEKMQHRLSLMDSYTLLALKDLKYLTLTGRLPKRDFEVTINPNFYDAIYEGKYLEAKEMLSTFENMTSFVMENIINKIVDIQTEKDKDKTISLK